MSCSHLSNNNVIILHCLHVFAEETSQPEFGQFFRDVTSLLKEKTGETGEIYWNTIKIQFNLTILDVYHASYYGQKNSSLNGNLNPDLCNSSALFHSYMIDPHNNYYQLPVDTIAQVVHDFFLLPVEVSTIPGHFMG